MWIWNWIQFNKFYCQMMAFYQQDSCQEKGHHPSISEGSLTSTRNFRFFFFFFVNQARLVDVRSLEVRANTRRTIWIIRGWRWINCTVSLGCFCSGRYTFMVRFRQLEVLDEETVADDECGESKQGSTELTFHLVTSRGRLESIKNRQYRHLFPSVQESGGRGSFFVH